MPAADQDLNDEQLNALELAVQGTNLFITGGAGTGKSFTLMVIVDALKRLYGAASVGTAASTGIAADAIDGDTVHSLLGLHLGEPREEPSEAARARLTALKVLIIDEISMLDEELMDTLCRFAKAARGQPGSARRGLPLGGLQLIVCGDFYQLPSVGGRPTTTQSRASRSCASPTAPTASGARAPPSWSTRSPTLPSAAGWQSSPLTSTRSRSAPRCAASRCAASPCPDATALTSQGAEGDAAGS